MEISDELDLRYEKKVKKLSYFDSEQLSEYLGHLLSKAGGWADQGEGFTKHRQLET